MSPITTINAPVLTNPAKDQSVEKLFTKVDGETISCPILDSTNHDQNIVISTLYEDLELSH